jgi:hypothetical protein
MKHWLVGAGFSLMFVVSLVTGPAACTTGNRNSASLARAGESCANQACQRPATCVDVMDEGVLTRQCAIVCSETQKCPLGMECFITNESINNTCHPKTGFGY